MIYFISYIVIINTIAFISMYIDKRRAKRKQYRIPEKTLFLLAIVGGSIGSLLGMETFRHKTKHWYFKWGMPLILVCQVVLLGFILSRI